MLKVDEQIVCHPENIGRHLRAVWEVVLCPNIAPQMEQNDF